MVDLKEVLEGEGETVVVERERWVRDEACVGILRLLLKEGVLGWRKK